MAGRMSDVPRTLLHSQGVLPVGLMHVCLDLNLAARR